MTPEELRAQKVRVLTKRGVDPNSISDEQFASAIETARKAKETGFLGDMVNQARQGFAATRLAYDFGVKKDPVEAAKRAAELMAVPVDPILQEKTQNYLADFDKQEGFLDKTKYALGEIFSQPEVVAGAIAQSLPQSIIQGAAAIPPLVAGTAAAPFTGGASILAGRAGAAGAIGGTSFFFEQNSGALQALAAAGVDITDPVQLEAAMNNPEVMSLATEYGAKRGLPIAAFDALSAGLAGRFIKPGMTGGLGVNALKEMGVQSSLGATGEFAAQVNAGDPLNAGQIALEGLAEIGTALPEAGYVSIRDSLLKPKTGSDIALPATVGEPLSKESTSADETLLPSTPTSPAPSSGVSFDVPFSETEVRGPTTEQIQFSIAAQKQKPPSPKKALTGIEKQAANLIKSEERGPVIDVIEVPTPLKVGSGQQMKKRLLASPRPDLVAIADRAGIPTYNEKGKPLTKSVIADSILRKYGVNPNRKSGVQTGKPIEVRGPAPQGLTTPSADNPMASDPVTMQQTPGVSKRRANATTAITPKQMNKAAKEFLKALPVRAKRMQKVSNLLGNPIIKFSEDTHNTLLQSASSTPADFAKAFLDSDIDNNFIKGIKDTIPKKTGVSPKRSIISSFKSYVQDPTTFKGPEELKPKLEQLKAVYDAFKQDAPSLLNEEQIIVRQSELNYEAIKNEMIANEMAEWQMNNQDLADQVTRTSNYTLDRAETINMTNDVGVLGALFQFLDNFRSGIELANRHKWFAGYMNLAQMRNALSNMLGQDYTARLDQLVKKHGEQRTEEALRVLDEMSRPFQTGGFQKLVYNKDGTLNYINRKNKRVQVDSKTAEVIGEIHAYFKRILKTNVQIAMSRLASVDKELQGKDITPAAIRTRFEMLRDTKALTPDELQEYESALNLIEDALDIMIENRAYFPHMRSQGPFAIALFEKTPEGERVLKGFYPIRAKAGIGKPKIDPEHLAEVRAQIEEDLDDYGLADTLTTVDGRPYTEAVPFEMTRDALINTLARNGTLTPQAMSAISSLLTAKGVNPSLIEEVFESVGNKGQEYDKMWKNIRPREGYLGYDRGSRINVIANYATSNAYLASQFRYGRQIATMQDKIREALKSGGRGAAPMLNMVEKHFRAHSSPSSMAAQLRTFAFFWFLFGNVSTAALQIVTTITMSPANIGQFYSIPKSLRGAGKSVINFKKAEKLRTILNTRNYKEFLQKGAELGFKPNEIQLISALRNQGFLDPNAANEVVSRGDTISKFSKPGNKYSSGNNFTNSIQKNMITPVKNAGSFIISWGEEVGRINTVMQMLDAIQTDPQWAINAGTTYYAKDPMYRSMVDGEFNGDKFNIEALARHTITNTHGMFSNETRPLFLQSPLGAAAAPMVTYPIQLLENIGRMMFERGGKGARGGAVFLLLTMAYFGAKALPLFSTFDWITKLLQRMTGTVEARGLEPLLERSLAEMGLTDSFVSQIVKGGIPSLMGIELSSRVSASFWGQQYLDMLIPPSEGFGGNMNTQMYGMFSSLVGAFGAARYISQHGDQDYLSAFLMNGGAPTVVANLLKGVHLGTMDQDTGYISNARGDVLLRADSEAWGDNILDNIVAQTLGFNTTPIAEARMANYIANDTANNLRVTQTPFMAKLGRQIANFKAAETPEEKAKFKQKIVEAYSELRAYNASLPEKYRLSEEELLKRAKSSTTRRVKDDLEPQNPTLDKRIKMSDLADMYDFGDLEKDLREIKD